MQINKNPPGGSSVVIDRSSEETTSASPCVDAAVLQAAQVLLRAGFPRGQNRHLAEALQSASGLSLREVEGAVQVALAFLGPEAGGAEPDIPVGPERPTPGGLAFTYWP